MIRLAIKGAGKKSFGLVFFLRKIDQIKKWNANQQAETELDFMKTHHHQSQT